MDPSDLEELSSPKRKLLEAKKVDAQIESDVSCLSVAVPQLLIIFIFDVDQ
jgi:hypothetical protein